MNRNTKVVVFSFSGAMFVLLTIDFVKLSPTKQKQGSGHGNINRPLQKELQLANIPVGNHEYPEQTKHPNRKRQYNVVETQEQRRRTLRNVCASYGADVNKTTNITEYQLPRLSFIHVIPEFKVLYCAIPKVGCTSWKRSILDLTGHTDMINDLQRKKYAVTVHEMMQYIFKPLSSLGLDEARQVLKSYKTFMFVRNPYSRVLSAYKDKILQDKKTKWRDQMLEWMVKEDPQSAADVFLGRRNFTFEEFLRFYLIPQNDNPHWREYYRLCLPCFIEYDFIGKFETIAEDSRYVLETFFHANSSKGFGKSERITNSSKNDILKESYLHIPKDLLRRISKYGGFTYDSELFGYAIPDVIQEFLQ